MRIVVFVMGNIKTKRGGKHVLPTKRKRTPKGQVFRGVDFGYEALPDDGDWLAHSVNSHTRRYVGSSFTRIGSFLSQVFRVISMVGRSKVFNSNVRKKK